jgi:hypothetical protein
VIVVQWIAGAGARSLIAQPILDDHVVPVHALLPVPVVSLLRIAAGKRRRRNNGDKSDFHTP